MRRKYILAVITTIPAVFLVCILVARLSTGDHSVDTEEGMSYLDAMNVYNVQSVEDRINSIKTGEINTIAPATEPETQIVSESTTEYVAENNTQKETETVTEKETEKITEKETQTETEKVTDPPVQESSSSDKNDLKELFANSLFVGDSIMTGFSDFRLVNSGNVIAHVGSMLDHHLQDNMQTIINYNPKTLILHYGLNEIGEAQHYLDEFITRYTKDLQQLKKALPNTKIIVVGLMPVKQQAIDREARFGRVGAYNDRMKKMCDEIGVNFYMNSELFSSHFDMYNGDGVHFVKKLYLIWMDDFIKEMGLK